MIVCHVCGTENPDGSKFCEGCGVELSAAQVVQAAAPVVEAAIAPVVETTATVIEDFPAVVAEVVQTPNLESAADAVIPGLSAVLPVEPPALPADEAALEIETPVVVEATIDPVVEAVVAPVAVAAVPVVAAVVAASEPAFNSKATMEAPVGNAAKVARLIPRNLGVGSNEGYIMHSERMVVGRFDPSAGPVDIDLSGGQGENYISRRHAEVYLENGAWLVRDLGSTNGVYVKRAGQAQYSPRIIEPQTLLDGDEVAFGNMKFLFVNSSDVA